MLPLLSLSLSVFPRCSEEFKRGPTSCEFSFEAAKCKFKMTTMAVVVPFPAKQIDMMQKALKFWGHPDVFPCDRTKKYRHHVDLVFQFTVSTVEAHQNFLIFPSRRLSSFSFFVFAFCTVEEPVPSMDLLAMLWGVEVEGRWCMRFPPFFFSPSVHEFPPPPPGGGLWLVLQDSFAEVPGLQQKVLDITKPYRQCFREVRFLSMNLDSAQKQYDGNRFSPSPSTMFHTLLGMEEMVKSYSHFFLFEPDALPFRAEWVDRLLLEVMLDQVDFWQKGSMAYYNPEDDHHINGNALYRLGHHGYNCFLERVLSVMYPYSFDYGQYFVMQKPDNFHLTHRFLLLFLPSIGRMESPFLSPLPMRIPHPLLHPSRLYMHGRCCSPCRYIRSLFIQNSQWKFNIEFMRKNHNESFLVHGKAACKILYTRYADFLETA